MSGGGGEAGAVCSFCLVLKLNDCTQICSYSFQTFQTQTFFCLFIFLIYETGTPPPCWPLMSRAASLHCSFCTKVKPLLAFFSFYLFSSVFPLSHTVCSSFFLSLSVFFGLSIVIIICTTQQPQARNAASSLRAWTAWPSRVPRTQGKGRKK